MIISLFYLYGLKARICNLSINRRALRWVLYFNDVSIIGEAVAVKTKINDLASTFATSNSWMTSEKLVGYIIFLSHAPQTKDIKKFR